MYRSEVMSLLKTVVKVPLTSVKPVISSVCVRVFLVNAGAE